jgi:hypothetical protein
MPQKNTSMVGWIYYSIKKGMLSDADIYFYHPGVLLLRLGQVSRMDVCSVGKGKIYGKNDTILLV